MNRSKKVLSLLLVVIMSISCIHLTVNAATFNDINQSGIFVKQQNNNTCTLASAVMLVRRTAMAAGNNSWSSITESSMRGTAWLEGSGLYYNFTYAGVSVGHATINSDIRLAYIDLLNKYPQGVVAYNPGWNYQTHAVLLTDYDATTDTFYCSDPANNIAGGRIPLNSSSIKGQGANGQNDKLSVLTEYWYVKSPSVTITTVTQPTTIMYPTNGATYKIASAVGSDKYLDFACSSNNVQIYENCDGHSDPAFVKSQYFTLKHIGDGWYKIINNGNNFAVDVAGANPAPETNVWQWEQINYDAQLFRFYDAGNGYCYIKSKLGCYLDVEGGINANNTNVQAFTFNGTDAQKWKLQSHAHSYSSSVTIQPTCTKEGVRTNTCFCGVSYTESIAKNAHSYSSSVTTQPSCTKEGVRTFKCSCGASYTEIIAKTSHNSNITIPAVSATCTNTGLTEGKKCSVCGTVTVAQQTIAMKAHSYTSSVTTQPTCSKEGVRTYTCSCGDTYTETIKKITHKYNAVVTNPTCTKQGFTTYTCECGDSYIADYTDANGHSYTSEITTPATHLTEGVETFTCTCGDTYTEAIDKLAGHTYEAVVTDPTCTERGYTTYTCECSDSYVADYVNETGHNHTSEITTPATHLTEGVETFTCTCGDSYTEVIEKLTKHSYNAVITTPTCVDKGYTAYTCECGDSYVSDFTETISHNDADGDVSCDYCGEDLYEYNGNTNNCSHICHKTGILGFFWKIINFFNKLFGINPICECGIAHY